MLTQQKLCGLLNYNQTTGVFRWRIRPGGRVRQSLIAGCFAGPNGSVLIGIHGRVYLAHRLAWLYVHGRWPRKHIDHIDGNTSNNRIANLRDVSRSVNLQNRHGPASHNKCGLLGVVQVGRKWRAEIRTNGTSTHLGRFDTKETAHAAYLAAKRRIHPGCTI